MVSTLITGAVAFLVWATVGDAQTLVRRARLGNNTEDITDVHTGPLANHIIIMDGVEAWAFPAQGRGNSQPRVLFDLVGLDLNWEPRGITWIPSRHVFALNNLTQLVYVDHRGREIERFEIQYPDDYPLVWSEGLSFIPETAAHFPNHILMPSFGGDPYCRIFVLSLHGEVAAEIFLQPQVSEVYSVAYLESDRLLVAGPPPADLWIIDFDGSIVSGPFPMNGPEGTEGPVQIADGSIVATGYWEGALFFYDQSLDRMPDKDRSYKIGSNLVRLPGRLAWEAARNRFLSINRIDGRVIAISPELGSVQVVADPPADGYPIPRGFTVLPDEELMAIAHRDYGVHAILLYGLDGTFTEEIDLSWLGRPTNLDFMPDTNEFLVRLLEPGFENRLVVLGRDGAYHREIDLSPASIGSIFDFAYFNPDHPSGGQLLVVEDVTRVFVTDLDGNLLDELDLRAEFGVFGARVTWISTGTDAGAFAALSPSNSELVIFTLP
jgi:hypothetical protein